MVLIVLIAFALSSCADTKFQEFESDIELLQSTDDEEGEDSRPGTGG